MLQTTQFEQHLITKPLVGYTVTETVCSTNNKPKKNKQKLPKLKTWSDKPQKMIKASIPDDRTFQNQSKS